MSAIERYDVYAHEQGDLMKGLLQVHPTVVLDEMLSGDEQSRSRGVRVFLDLFRFRKNTLDVVPDDALLEWCDREPAVRYPTAAACATLFRRPKDNAPHEWTPLVSQLLMKAPDPRRVFTEIVQRLRPTSWSGSLATKLEARLKLLEQLPVDGAPDLLNGLSEAKATLQEWIGKERKREADEERSRSGRFE
jgi:hypothetical protein